MPKCQVPQISSNSISIPRVFIGDRGFLKRYGSQLSQNEILGMYEYAVSRGNFGACSGDESTASILSELKNTYDISTIYHTRFLLSLGNKYNITSAKLASTLRYYYGDDLSEDFKINDSIIAGFMNQGGEELPLSQKEINGIVLDSEMIERDLKSIYLLQPTLITVGGDWLDLAIACGLDDLIHKIINYIHQVTRKHNTSLLLFSYMYPLIRHYQSFMDMDHIQGLFCPVNITGNGMPPNRDAALQVICNINKLKIGMHILGGGCIPVLPALDFALNHRNVDAVVVGVSCKNNIDSLIQATKQCFTI